jgi:hypothetical protein
MVDAVAPSISGIQLQGNPQPSDQSISFLVTFDEAVTHVDLNDFSLSTSGGVSANISELHQLDAQRWVVVVDNITGSGGIRLDVKSATDIADPFGNVLANGFNAGASFISQLPPLLVAAAPLGSIAPVSTGEPPALLQSAPLIVLTSATTEIGGATNSGLITLAGSNNPLNSATADIDMWPIGSAPIGSDYTLNMSALGAPIERASDHRDTGLPSPGNLSFETGVPLFIPLPGVSAADLSQHYSVEVRMQDGKPLLPWLHFEPATGSLSGQAPRGFAGKLHIQIIVYDGQGGSSVRVMELRFSDKIGAGARDSGREVPAQHIFIKDSPRHDQPGADAGKPGLNDQFAHYGAGGRARDASALLSVLHQVVAAARADRA